MRVTVKTKIWITVLSVVLMFAFFVLFYLPKYQGTYLLNNYNKEIQNNARTVALGVKIAITEENFEGVQTAMDYVKGEPYLLFVSLLQTDTVWNATHTKFEIKKTVFKTYPDSAKVISNLESNDSIVVKRAPIITPVMNGEIMLGFTTSGIMTRVAQIRKLALFVSAIIFLIGIVMGFWLAKNISVPVLALRDAADKVGKGDLTQRVVSRSNDEIGELGIAFNKMVDDLSHARRDVEERTSELIIEKKKSDDLLEDLKKTLVNLKETQDQLIRQEKFASIGQLTKGIVDRLLNPLNYINNFSLISKDLVQETKEAFENIKADIAEEHYDELNDLFQMVETNLHKINEHGSSASRIVKAMEKLLRDQGTEFVITDINTLIQNHLNIAGQEAKHDLMECDVKLVAHYDQTNPKIKVLPIEFGSVIVNLAANSYYSLYEKYKSSNECFPLIHVSTKVANGLFEVRIRDNGKGIGKGELSKLFSPFFTTKPTSKGTGLGLYISQEIIKTHKGNIAVDSKEGEYTEFIITIPAIT